MENFYKTVEWSDGRCEGECCDGESESYTLIVKIIDNKLDATLITIYSTLNDDDVENIEKYKNSNIDELIYYLTYNLVRIGVHPHEEHDEEIREQIKKKRQNSVNEIIEKLASIKDGKRKSKKSSKRRKSSKKRQSSKRKSKN